LKERQLPGADLAKETDPCTPHCSSFMTASQVPAPAKAPKTYLNETENL